MLSVRKVFPVLAIATLVGATSIALTAGCGGGNDASLSAVVNAVEFIGRTYTGSVPIDAGRAAALNLKVAANGTANGTMTLASRAVGVGRATPIVSKVGGIVNLQPAR